MVSDSVSKKFGIGKSFRFGFVQIWGILSDISVSKLLGFETFPFFLMVSVSVSEIFGIEKSIGIGFEKKLVLKKYESVSKQFG